MTKSYLRDRVLSLIEWLKNKDNLLKIVLFCVYYFLFTKVVTNLVYGTEIMYDVFRNYFFYRAVSYFLIALLIVRRARIFNWLTAITAVVYSGAYVKYFYDNLFDVDYKNLMLAQSVAQGLFLVFVIDLIRTGKYPKWTKDNKIYKILLILAFSLAVIINFNVSKLLIIPFLALIFTPIKKNTWIKLMDIFTLAFYTAFVKIMTTSLRLFPYSEGSMQEKYYGTFLNIATGGMFAAGAFACVLYWIVKLTRKGWKISFPLVIAFLAFIYPLISAVMFNSRTAQLTIFLMPVFIFVFAPVNIEKKVVLRRILFVVLGLFVLVGLGIVTLQVLAGLEVENVNYHVDKGLVDTYLWYWSTMAARTLNAATENGLFAKGTFLAMLDTLTSYRLSVPYAALKSATLLGKNDITVTIGECIYVYPHNNYVTWIVQYGFLGGIPMIIWFISSFVVSTKQMLKKNYACIFSFIWMTFMFIEMFTETVLPIYPATLVLLLVQYPLFVDMSEE